MLSTRGAVSATSVVSEAGPYDAIAQMELAAGTKSQLTTVAAR